jgi:hypothetical protein
VAHQLATATAGEQAALGVAQLSGGQRTLLSLALILAVRGPVACVINMQCGQMGVQMLSTEAYPA